MSQGIRIHMILSTANAWVVMDYGCAQKALIPSSAWLLSLGFGFLGIFRKLLLRLGAS